MNNRRNLAMAFGAGALAVAMLLGYLIWSGYREAIQSAETTSRNYAATIEARLDATLRRADAHLSELTRNLPVAALSKQAMPRHARELDAGLDLRLLNFPELAGLRVFDADGDQLYSSDRANTPRSNIEDRGYFRQLRDEPQAGPAFEVNIARTTGRPTLVVARPVRDKQGVFHGIVIASVELEYFQKLFRLLDIGPQGVNAIRRSDNFTQVVRWPSFDSETNKALAPDRPVPRAITTGQKEGTLSVVNVDGVARILSFRKLERYPFFVASALGREDVLAGWRARSLGVGLAGLLLLGLLAGLLYRLMRAEAQRMRTMLSLTRSEEQAQQILDSSMDVVISMTSDGLVSAWGAGAHRMFGYTRSEAMGKVLADLIIPPSLRDAHNRGMKRFHETGTGSMIGRRMETTAIRADGSEFPIELSVACIRRDNGHFFSAFVRDIAERKWIEDSLRSSEDRYRDLVENSGDLICTHDLEGRLLSVNMAASKALGYSPKLLLGTNLGDLLTTRTKEQFPAYLAEIRVQGKSSGVMALKTAAGEVRYWEFRNTLRSADVDIPIVRGMARDITERQRAERALIESEERFRSLFEQAAVGVAVLESATGRYIRVNQKFADILGYTIEEVLQRTARTITHHDDLPENLAELERLKAGELSSFNIEKRYYRKDGSIVWVHVTVSPMRRADGRFIHHTSIVQDITERKQLEAKQAQLEMQLRESQKMEAIGTLAGGIAHDFNNIIATILGNAELALDDASANPKALESLLEIHKAGLRARDVVQQILSFSRRQATERELTVLASVIDEAVGLLRATLPARIAIDVHCDAGVPLARVDATQIQQVLINLAANSMQAMRGRPGRIGIRLDTVMLDTALADTHPALRALYDRHPGRTVRLAVSDDGVGMDAAILGRIFEPFFTTKPIGEGTGLGLAVVHGIVQVHEGAIVVDSAPGKGTTFTICLPTADVPAGVPVPDKIAMEPVLSPDVGRHILYLDDEESLVFLVKRLLERGGYRASVYTDQQEALAALRADPGSFDLVVSDYNMPGMSGLDVAHEVRSIDADLPVAVTSGFIDDVLQERADAAGVELIFKVTAVEELCAMFARLARTVRAKSKTF